MDDLRAAFASPQGRVTAADAAHLQEIAPVRSMIFTMGESALVGDLDPYGQRASQAQPART
ncbi:hypothetical protein [Streptomyces sp. NPDC001500]